MKATYPWSYLSKQTMRLLAMGPPDKAADRLRLPRPTTPGTLAAEQLAMWTARWMRDGRVVVEVSRGGLDRLMDLELRRCDDGLEPARVLDLEGPRRTVGLMFDDDDDVRQAFVFLETDENGAGGSVWAPSKDPHGRWSWLGSFVHTKDGHQTVVAPNDEVRDIVVSASTICINAAVAMQTQAKLPAPERRGKRRGRHRVRGRNSVRRVELDATAVFTWKRERPPRAPSPDRDYPEHRQAPVSHHRRGVLATRWVRKPRDGERVFDTREGPHGTLHAVKRWVKETFISGRGTEPKRARLVVDLDD